MLCAVALLLRNVLILVAFGELLLVLACDVWENLGKWNKNGGCVFWPLALVVLLCGAVAGGSLPLGIGAFWHIGYIHPPLFLHF